MIGTLSGRIVPRGQSPSAPGSGYSQVQEIPASLTTLGSGILYQPPAPVMARSLGQSPEGQRRIVDGAEGFGSGLFTVNTDLNSVLNTEVRVLTPPEFYDGQTNTRR